ncbi:S-adenosyl-L-methionine-dependent methyltransferase [Tricharina praecox]|uniref:S-adenosyl-L-methionine-dependent methyltransferase n=1 Tax=Tricharina praecox TaxID=43433 RepID=UPI00221F8473|nr:S-adenosyl-L-methionine-dependent methyltransferase [Tricharina praecox]KAI5840911.1 S-adenosyl-L-methionine-dependent methyltransferase [Tricharina praecox]
MSAAEKPFEVGPLEADPNPSDDDGYASSLESDTTSLKSTMRDYIFENGRRYHRYQEGKYVLPNDENEQDRLDLHHHVWLLAADGNLTFAPIKDPHRILDVGTGTGIWALDAAETWPSAEVIGTDLSPIQPSWTFSNCRFEIDDAELTWTFPNNHFDFIHSRTMAQSIRDWPNYVRQMYKHTAPGGYVEIVELFGDNFCDDGTLKPNGGLRTYYKHWIPAMEKSLNFKQPTDADYAQFLKDAGFVDVKVYHRKQILSPWPKDKTLKEMGRYNLLNVQTGYHAYGMALFTRVCGFTTEEATKLCNDARDDASSTKTHVYNKMWFIVARKPTE